MQNEQLFSDLDQDLTDTFEDNILVKYARYALPIDQQIDPASGRKLYQHYMKARLAYLRAVADIIQNADAIDEELY